MKTSDFGICLSRCQILVKKIRERGYIDAVIVYGVYTPDTESSTWDERWAQSGRDSFTHFWIEVENMIFDASAQQFGHKEKIQWAHIEDIRYHKVGYLYRDEEFIKIPECIYTIKWGTIDRQGDCPKIQIEVA